MSQITFSTLPSLNALAAFEAVARVQSFSHAAGELCVMHSAMVRLLKDPLGTCNC